MLRVEAILKRAQKPQTEEQPAAEIIREMFTEAAALLKGAAQWVK